nr:Os12g0514450 [Ipomoea batatas]
MAKEKAEVAEMVTGGGGGRERRQQRESFSSATISNFLTASCTTSEIWPHASCAGIILPLFWASNFLDESISSSEKRIKAMDVPWKNIKMTLQAVASPTPSLNLSMSSLHFIKSLLPFVSSLPWKILLTKSSSLSNDSLSQTHAKVAETSSIIAYITYALLRWQLALARYIPAPLVGENLNQGSLREANTRMQERLDPHA